MIRRLPHRGEDGQVTAFTVVMVTALLLVAGLVLDGGAALAAKVEAIGIAEDAARAGAQEIDLAAYRATGRVQLVPDRAVAAARTYLTTSGHTGTATVTGDEVTVTVSTTIPTLLLGLAGVDDLTVSSQATAGAHYGITAADP